MFRGVSLVLISFFFMLSAFAQGISNETAPLQADGPQVGATAQVFLCTAPANSLSLGCASGECRTIDYDQLASALYQKLRDDAEKAVAFRLDIARDAQWRFEIVTYLVGAILVSLAAYAAFLGIGRIAQLKGDVKSELAPLVEDVSEIFHRRHFKPIEERLLTVERRLRFKVLEDLVKELTLNNPFRLM